MGVFLVREGKVSLRLDGVGIATRTLGPGSLLGLPPTLKALQLDGDVTKDSRLDFISREAVLLILHSDTLVCFQALQNILGGKFLKHAPNRLRRTERSQPVTIRNRYC